MFASRWSFYSDLCTFKFGAIAYNGIQHARACRKITKDLCEYPLKFHGIIFILCCISAQFDEAPRLKDVLKWQRLANQGVFGLQRMGSRVIGWIAGPVMVLWFLTIAALGVYQMVLNPQCLRSNRCNRCFNAENRFVF